MDDGDRQPLEDLEYDERSVAARPGEQPDCFLRLEDEQGVEPADLEDDIYRSEPGE